MADPTVILSGQSTAVAQSQAPDIQSAAYFKPPIHIQKINEALDNASQINILQYPVDRPKYYMLLRISEYSRTSATRLGNLTEQAAIVLPLPLQMMDNHSVIYYEDAIGGVTGTAIEAGAKLAGTATAPSSATGVMKNAGESVNDLIANSQNLPQSVRDALNSGIGQALGPAAAGAGASVATSALDKLGLGATARAFLGYSPNQFMTVLLKGPSYKNNEFSWKLSPRNEDESLILNTIIRVLNNYMAPGIALGGGVFTFPSIFEIAFIPNSKYLFKFKPAVLENFSLSYSGSGIPSFYRPGVKTDNLGAPESIELRMRFKELEFWLNGDFKNTTNPYDH